LESSKKNSTTCSKIMKILAMNLQGKETFHLPQVFNKNSYDAILEFMGIKPIFSQPHMHDLMKDLEDVYKDLNIKNAFDKKN
jgi:hypothetical protein